jgi:hypothetical protein
MKTLNPNQLTAAQLRQAADLADNIATMQGQLDALLGGQPVAIAASKGGGRFTPAQRKKISEGQKRRWAERHAAQAVAAGQAPATGTAAPVIAPTTAPAQAPAQAAAKPVSNGNQTNNNTAKAA